MFIFDEPYIWYVTAEHILKESHKVYVYVNHQKTNRYLVDISSLHKQHGIEWVIDEKQDLAATLFPSDPDFKIKAISFPTFLKSEELIPSMTCYSVGCPYGLAGFDMNNITPCVLDGIVSGIDTIHNRIYVTVPTFPGNSGGPLFVWKEPIKPNGDAKFSEQILYFGGIISEYALVGNGISGENYQSSPPSMHLGVVIPAESISNLLQSEQAVIQKKHINSQNKKK